MSTPGDFIHLHNHSEYSFLDGAIRIKDMVAKAKDFGMQSLALTDHGGMFGALEFFDKCKSAEIKPVIGFEAYIAPRGRFDKTSTRDERSTYHLLLLAKNKTGYQNLMRLSSIGYQEGFYYKPRIDTEVLRQHAQGVIGSSACIGGHIPRLLLAGKRDEAKKIAQEYMSIFDEGDFYFELQNHGIDEELQIYDELISLGKELGAPFIVANDAHYLTREDSQSHEILLCIQTQTTMDDPNRYRFSTDQVYFKSPQEMHELFPNMEEAFKNTVDIADKCNVELFEKPQLPGVDVPPEYTDPDDYLCKLAHKGLKEKYDEVTDELIERLEHELQIIISMGFSGYFLIVRDFVAAARIEGIMVNTRGSASGSLVGHAIDISLVDPMKYDLLFERFLNPERISMPDIDVDFPDKDRYRVIDYVVQKYGREAVCQIINYGRMKAKMVVRDVARAMGISVADTNKLAGMVNEKTIQKSIDANKELADAIKGNPQYEGLFKHARVLEGLARQAGMHAGGVIIAPGNVVDWAPLFKQPNSDSVMTQFDMKYVEEAGLIKMDFLGLRTLTLLQETVRLIKQYHGKDIDIWKLADGDEKTYELYGRGETVGVFQFESNGMQEYLRKLKPTCIDDLIAMTALYRPGPMKNIDTYIQRKHGKEKVELLHPLLGDVLNVTYGVIIYQEQVMRIAQMMGGFSLGQADILRKAMGKKQMDKMEAMGKKFMAGAEEKGIPGKTARQVFDLMAKFAEYGFCKGHACSYAHVSYYAAWLKAHYPVEYMCANLTSWLGNQDNFLIIKNEAERMGIKVLPPDVNKSDNACNIDDGNIRLGIGAIKNVGQGAEAILESRQKKPSFDTIFNFCRNIDLRHANKKCLESLCYAGALDSLKGTRAQLFESIDRAIEYGSSFQKDRLSGQTNLFDNLLDESGNGNDGVQIPEPQLNTVEPWPYNELLTKEKEILNFYVSGHPLDHFRDEVIGFSTISLSPDNLTTLKDGDKVTVGGIVTSFKTYTQRDGRQMAFLTMEDFDGPVELLVFGDAFEKFKHILTMDAMVLIHGTITLRDNERAPKLRVENVLPLSETREKLTRSVHLKLRTDTLAKDTLQQLSSQFTDAKGNCSIIIHLVTQEENEYNIVSQKYKINPQPATVNTLRERIGKDNVWLSKTAA
ncbi:MAG: DNA polymerase III subunit alpha [Chitinivibrionales bacterium]|nr:DNA polymerase III subunit alpha [Chitinivibrionales bacterium]